MQGVEMNPGHRPCMSPIHVELVQAGLRTRTVVPIRLVNVPFFSAGEKGGCFIVWEVEAGNSDFGSLVVPCMLKL